VTQNSVQKGEVLVISILGKRKSPERRFGLRPSEKELPTRSVTKMPVIITTDITTG
jgi:hypothetical protein